MMPERPAETKSNETEAEKLARLLELELIQKRAAWKQADARHRTIRTLTFVFLFVFIAVCLVGFLFAFFRINEGRPNRQGPPTAPADQP